MRIHPFAAVRPAPGLEKAIASPPYDVVSTDEARQIAREQPKSFIRVVRSEVDLDPGINPYDDAVYAKANENFQRMLEEGEFVRDDEPAVYLYAQEWRGRRQIGVVTCCHIDDYRRDRIKKHEKTRRVKEDDRTRHVLSINANAGPVFLAYRDHPDVDAVVAEVAAGTPLYDFEAADGVRHTIWRAPDARPLVRAFASVDVAYVADGHHRAASAARAGDERAGHDPNRTGEEEYNWFLTALFPAGQLNILPYNRVVTDLADLSSDEFLSRLAGLGRLDDTTEPMPRQPGTIGIYVGGQWWRLAFPPDSIDRADPIASLDVSLLHERVLTPILGIGDPRTDERVDFVGGIRGGRYLEQLVDAGGAAAAFTLYPTSMQQLMAVADAGLIMPPKSTWFEPKLRSGLLVHTLD